MKSSSTTTIAYYSGGAFVDVLQIRDHLSAVLVEQDLEKRFDLTFTHAATDHAEMIQIHPFIDGIGRWARIVTNIFISDAGYAPGTIVRKADKPQYIAALDNCSDNNAPGALAAILAAGYLRELQKRNP